MRKNIVPNNYYIVIPAYNEEYRLPKLIKRLEEVTKLENIIVVDDGSKKMIHDYIPKQVRVFRHKTNLGKGMALKTGCEAALRLNAKAIILMDADGQHDPDDLHKFTSNLKNGLDVIFGARPRDENMPPVKAAGNWLLNNLASWLFGFKLTDIWCGYRGFISSAYRIMEWNASDYSSDVEMVINVAVSNLKYKEVPVRTIYNDKKSTTGTSLQDGIKLIADLFIWRLKRL